MKYSSKQKLPEPSWATVGTGNRVHLKTCLRDYSARFFNPSISVPDPGGSGFKLQGWIRIRNPNPDPGSEIEL